MSLIRWELKAIPFEHHEEISKLAAECIKKSINDDHRSRFDALKKEYKIENSMGAIGNEDILIPIIEMDIPEDIREYIIVCYCGVHQKYCEEKGL